MSYYKSWIALIGNGESYFRIRPIPLSIGINFLWQGRDLQHDKFLKVHSLFLKRDREARLGTRGPNEWIYVKDLTCSLTFFIDPRRSRVIFNIKNYNSLSPKPLVKSNSLVLLMEWGELRNMIVEGHPTFC